MSEVEARPPPTRGRSVTRGGGRGGFGRAGPRGSRKSTNGTTANDAAAADESVDDQGELGDMKRKYTVELPMLKDMFADWTDVDLLFALQECDGDMVATVDRITQGSVSQFSEVKKAKDRARSKVKEETAAAAATDKPAGVRGGRGRGGLEGSRVRGGRASDRGRGGHRGGRGGHATTNGASKDQAGLSVPTTESSAWNTDSATEPPPTALETATADAAKEADTQSAWANVVTSDSTPATASEGVKSSLIPEGGPKKTWASMFSQAAKPAAAAAKQPPQAQTLPAELAASDEFSAPSTDTTQEAKTLPLASEFGDLEQTVDTPPAAELPAAGEDLSITPSQDPLTEENVEHLPDASHPPTSLTAASTVGSADPRNLTPLPGPQVPIGRPPLGGYAASAYRATSGAMRSASFQRRVQEQQEAVVMPGHNAIDRAAVQFGSMGLNGEPGLDVDEEREDPETRQAPQHSPPSQLKTSLPPAPRQSTQAAEAALSDSLPSTKQAPGLPPASQQNQPQMLESALSHGLQQEATQANSGYNHFGGYGQGGVQQDSSAAQQKPYDPFTHQAQQQSYDRFGMQHHQAPQQAQQHGQSGFGGLSSAPTDYSSYYTSEPQRNAYAQYYGSSGNFPPQDNRGQPQQHDTGLGQQRAASGYGNNESAYAQQPQQQQVGRRYTPQLTPSRIPISQDMDERESFQAEMDRMLRKPSVLVSQSSASQSHTAGGMVDHNTRPGVVSTIPFAFNDLADRPPAVVLPSPPKIFLSPDLLFAQAQSRYGEAANSGHNTPNPLMGGQQQQQQQPNANVQQGSMHQQAPSHQQQSAYSSAAAAAAAGFPYGHPYFNSPYQQAYQNQFGFNPYGAGGGGSAGANYPTGKGGMYGAPQGYGTGSQSSYEQHPSTPGNAGAFGQNQQASMRSASGMTSSGLGASTLDDYGRGSAQGGSHQSNSGFGGISDPFARAPSGLGQGGYGSGQQTMASAAGPDESLKPFGDTKNGPSPALGQQPGRPGSAANNSGALAQSGLPPQQQAQQQQQQQQQQQPQTQQGAFGGGYQGFPTQGSQYGGLGGLGGGHQQQPQQQQQGQSGMGGQGGYGGGYGAGGFGQYGSYNSSRGGWGQSYGAH